MPNGARSSSPSSSRERRSTPPRWTPLCLDHIARFKRPKRYHFVDSLPKNNYGKVLKTALRELLNQGEKPC